MNITLIFEEPEQLKEIEPEELGAYILEAISVPNFSHNLLHGANFTSSLIQEYRNRGKYLR